MSWKISNILLEYQIPIQAPQIYNYHILLLIIKDIDALYLTKANCVPKVAVGANRPCSGCHGPASQAAIIIIISASPGYPNAFFHLPANKPFLSRYFALSLPFRYPAAFTCWIPPTRSRITSQSSLAPGGRNTIDLKFAFPRLFLCHKRHFTKADLVKGALTTSTRLRKFQVFGERRFQKHRQYHKDQEDG